MFVLLGLTAYVLLADDISFSSSSDDNDVAVTKPQPEPKVAPRKAPVPVAKSEPRRDGAFASTTTSAASGLSDFYGKIKKDLLGNSNTIGDGFVVKVKPSVYTLDEQLQHRGAMVKPGSPKFTGETTIRHFRKGETIRNQLSEAASQEGMALIWQLERDYIIKEYFQVNADFLKTLSSVAHALNSDFENHVYALYCFNQRAVVITYDYTDYVKSNCTVANKEKAQLPG